MTATPSETPLIDHQLGFIDLVVSRWVGNMINSMGTRFCDHEVINTLKLERVVSLVCTEVIHYNISTASIGSSAIAIFAQEVYWLFESNEPGGRGGLREDGRISMKLWMSHWEQILSPPALKCFYCCSHLGFLWTPQGTVVYWTIKYNLCSNPLQSP